MRFDLVDLNLFVSIAEARSITGGADRAALALASASVPVITFASLRGGLFCEC